MLYDTGSAITCMSQDTFERLEKTDIIHWGKKGNAEFTSASGDRITAGQRPTVEFEVLGKKVSFTTYVIKKLHEPFILGIDFIREENMNYCPRHREFSWNSICPQEKIASIALKQETVIPAMGQRLCQIQVSGPHLKGESIIDKECFPHPTKIGKKTINVQSRGV